MQQLKQIVARILETSPDIKSVFFVGCGASRADLYPAYYFLTEQARNLRASIHTAAEFCYATPVSVDETAVVITCSLGGATPETVKAAAVAKMRGAHTIAVTHVPDSPLTKDADDTVLFAWEESYSAKEDKTLKVLMLAVELLCQTEGYDAYPQMAEAMTRIYDAIDRAVTSVLPDAERFAKEHRDMSMLYVTSSGAMQEVAFSFSACLMMEMQWIASSSFNDGDFFHGPFEMVEKDVPYLLLMNDGKTRAMDSRTLAFLQRFGAKVTLIDAKDFGLDQIVAKEVIDYFNPVILSPIIRIYAEQLAVERNHPLTRRRYMWKLDY